MRMIRFVVFFLSLLCIQNTYPQLFSFPPKADPITIGNKLVNRFLEQSHSQYGSPLRANEPRTQITYPDVCAWMGGFWFARATSNEKLMEMLIERFYPLTKEESFLQPKPNHVDNNIFGVLPLEIYKQTGSNDYKKMGLYYADSQWILPEKYSKKELDLYNRGYSWQSRLWLDDMFMITSLQKNAYEVTNDKKYIERASKLMEFYLDSIQLDNGLFYHSPEARFCWSRGNGWMAVAMAEILRILPEDNQYRSDIMAGYIRMMRKLKECQSKNGMWLQLVDEPDLWEETSGSAMFAYAIIVGVKRGWLDESYVPVVEKSWLALVDYIDENGDIKDVCAGTNVGYTKEHYKNRPKITGDIHGLAPMIWCSYALVSNDI